MTKLIDDLKDFANVENVHLLLEEIDSLLEWHYKNDSGIENVLTSLNIIINEEKFINLIMYLIEIDNPELFSLVKNKIIEEVSESENERSKVNLVFKKLRYIAAKYNNYLFDKFEQKNSPTSWKSIRNKLVMSPKPELEVTILRNDYQTFTVNDTAEGIINLNKLILEDIADLKPFMNEKSLEHTKKELADLKELIEKLENHF